MKNEESLSHLVNKNVIGLGRYNAGLSVDEIKQKYHLDRVAKLGSNENPFPTSKHVESALQVYDNLGIYPDPYCSNLAEFLASKLSVTTTSIVVGNGSEDLISIISRTFVEAGDSVLTIVPSFGLHISYPMASGANVVTVNMTEQLTFDVEGIIEILKNTPPKLFFLASPSNPVGCSLNQQEIKRILQCIQPETLLIFDEAYYEYAKGDDDYPDVLTLLKASSKPFVLLRTFSKAYSLAGLRVGYGVFHPAELAGYVHKMRTPFNVNRQAQKAAIAALEDEEHLAKTMQWNHTARSKMMADLIGLGLSPATSKGNYLFFSTEFNGKELAQKLLSHGVIVKPWLEAGYENYIRVSIGSEQDNQMFISSLSAVLSRSL